MTCIVGVVDSSGNIFMGADSSAVDSNIVTRHSLPKVFRLYDFVIGYCHSFRLGQLVEHLFEPPPLDKDVNKAQLIDYMITDFIPELRSQLESHGYPGNEDERDNWALLVGVHGNLFTIESDFHLGHDETSYAAIGAGTEYALGAMYASLRTGKDRALDGLRAAEYFCPYVATPFNFVEARRERTGL